jgi:hypothetical protein
MRPALALILAVLAAAPASAGTRELRFSVDWGPVALAEVRFALSRQASELSLVGEAETDGLGALLSPFRVRNAAAWNADGSRSYRVEVTSRGVTEARELHWPAAGLPHLREAPEAEEEPLTPVPEGATLATVDPLFPVLDAMARLDRGEGCTGRWPVWDGTRRFDVSLADLGAEEVAADRDWTYAGPARACRLGVQRIGGFPVRGRWQTPEAEVRRIVWFADIDGRGHVPVRFEVNWPLGIATARIDLR